MLPTMRRALARRKKIRLIYLSIFLMILLFSTYFFKSYKENNQKTTNFKFKEFKFLPKSQKEQKIIGTDKKVYDLISKIKKKKI